jgi:hypothetical protein
MYNVFCQHSKCARWNWFSDCSGNISTSLEKMKRTEAGLIALRILQYKFGRRGLDMRSMEFERRVEKMTKLIGCKPHETISFFRTYLLPSVLQGRKIESNPVTPEPSDEDCFFAFKILSGEYFVSTAGLREEIQHICEAMKLDFHKVASLAHLIINQNLKREFGKDFAPEEIAD